MGPLITVKLNEVFHVRRFVGLSTMWLLGIVFRPQVVAIPVLIK